jgi:hypothetical protein
MEGLTENERKIIELLRELNPYEKIEITKDGSGKPDYYLIHRSQKIILTKTSATSGK